uniref:LIM domain 7a n=1 Tax=Echeneis naucrates TaxID=173247 RepID=A0A665VF00_ECHNA
MAENKDSLTYRRSIVITPKASTQFNQFLPTKDKPSGYVPAPLRKKRAERNEDNRRSWANPTYTEEEGTLTSVIPQQNDEDDDVGYADPVHDDLYTRKMGIKPQPAGNVSYDKFLPKFWTPQEDIHIEKIKLGSQRRPWYKKMQGFSPPQLPKIEPPLLVPPPLVFAPVDPTSGPRLVKCEKRPLLGRHDPREPPDPFDYDSIDPDLQNDDMFARRTLAFQSNTDLALVKSQLPRRRLYTSEPQLNIITQRRGSPDEDNYPDIEQDDVVYRKEKTLQTQQQRPLSGAPDNYAPMPIPEPWALPPDLKARLLCPPCPLTKEPARNKEDQAEKETRPKTDDMLLRKLGVCSYQSWSSPRGPSANQMTPSAPSACSEGDLQKWQAIREASQLRYKKKLMVERLAALKLSKSTSDILDDSAIVRQNRFEELQKYREQIKESEDKWQEDLNKWKSRRRSVNSDIVKKKEERDKIEQITYGSNRRSKTFKELQEERERTPPKTEVTATAASSSSSLQKERPLLRTESEVEAPSSSFRHKQQPQFSSMEAKPPAVSRVSASLPRSYQRSDSTRLTSVVAPRPYPTQPSRITSLPRVVTMDDSHKRVNGEADISKKSLVPSRYHQVMTSEDEAHSSSSHSSEDEEEEEEGDVWDETSEALSSAPSCLLSVAVLLYSTLLVRVGPQDIYCEMRINLNQKPNSSRDFGFQAAWDSTGARVTSIQSAGSQAEMCRLQAGDKVLTVNGRQVAEMSYTDWKSCMEEALQEGSLVMDVRHHGKNSESSKYCASLNIKLYLPWLNLFVSSVLPHCILFSISHVESEPLSLKNLKRRSEFFEQACMFTLWLCLLYLQIPVPSITPSSSRWSWDPEEERRRQEKWQKEQERLLQVHTDIPILEVNSHGVGPHSPLMPVSQLTPTLWEEEERKRNEEQERQRQAEEKRRREEEERELQRLQEERKRKEREEEEERKRRVAEELRWQKRREEEREEERRRQEAAEQQRREQEWASEQLRQQRPWSVLHHQTLILSIPFFFPPNFSFTISDLFLTSTNLPLYQAPYFINLSTLGAVTGGGAGQLPLTQAELERQQILNEMKKKTSLLTDSSWIRQNPSSTFKCLLTRESLDNLDGSYNSWRSSWSPRSNTYAQNYTRPQSALSGSTSSYTGWSGAQRPASSTLPSSYSVGSLRGGSGTPSSHWSRQTPSPSLSSPSPTISPEPTSEAGPCCFA